MTQDGIFKGLLIGDFNRKAVIETLNYISFPKTNFFSITSQSGNGNGMTFLMDVAASIAKSQNNDVIKVHASDIPRKVISSNVEYSQEDLINTDYFFIDDFNALNSSRFSMHIDLIKEVFLYRELQNKSTIVTSCLPIRELFYLDSTTGFDDLEINNAFIENPSKLDMLFFTHHQVKNLFPNKVSNQATSILLNYLNTIPEVTIRLIQGGINRLKANYDYYGFLKEFKD